MRWPMAEGLNIALALLQLSSLGLADVNADLARQVSLCSVHSRTILIMSSGQQAELTNQEPWGLAEYEQMLQRKVVPALRWECSAGPILAGKPLGPFESLGESIGLLYQLANDFLGLRSSDRSDLCQHWTWPTVYAWHVATEVQKVSLKQAWAVGDKDIVQQLAIRPGSTTVHGRPLTLLPEASE